MSIYNDLDLDSILNSSFSAQEGLDDIALEIEDRDKILFNLSQLSRSSTLKVDYSDFKNHVFFGSAYALTNFALYRLYQDYPIFGELKDINEWRRINSGYENWFFDNYPKYTGYLNLLSQSGAPPYVVANDYQGYITNLATSSFTVEFIFSSSNQNDLGRIFEISDAANNNAIEIYYSSSMNFVVAAGGLAALLTCSFAVNTSHHVACVYSYPEQKQYIYIDNLLFASRSTPSLGALNINRPNVNIGASTFAGETFYLYGQLDEFRFWNQDRRPFLAKTFYRGITANHSGGLQLYYKFNESPDVGNKIIDYSGNNIHGFLTGGYSLQTNLISGTILSSFNDSGIPILSLTNSLVSTFVNQQLSAAILYDSNNRNNIFNIVPSYMTDDTIDSEDQQRFLLLIARHYDRLKLSIQHLSNVMYSDERNFNTTPDEFINLVAKHYGLDVSDVYSSSDLSQYFFGENVLTTGSLSTSLLTIKNQLRRNLLNNLIYIIKTKSTRESIQSSLRSLGFNNEAIAVNEYSKLSGGISTTYDQKTVERKVIRFLTSSTLYLTSLAYSFTNTSSFLYEVRAKFLTSSTFVTSSVFHVGTNNGDVNLFVQRENPSSSNAVVKYKSDLLLSSSLLNIWDGNWINFAFGTNFSSSASSLLITKLNGNFLEISGAYFSASRSGGVIGFTASSTGSVWLGSSSSARPFEGYMQEFRAWRDLDLNDQATRTSFINHGKNFESIEVPNFLTDLDKLAIYHKLNDHNFTIISGALIGIHDYVSGTDYKSYLSGSSSFEFNTPGLVIPKLEPSTVYDIGVNNSKIRIKNSDKFTKRDINEDIPYISIDASPVNALNKEIIKWFGGLDNFSNIIGFPYLRFRDEMDTLNLYRYLFTNKKLNSKINFSAYLNLIKWFDSNFTFFLQQLIPLDIISSLSNFVIEPHIFEYNKIDYKFPYRSNKQSTTLVASASAMPGLTASSLGRIFPLGDPGRWGAVVAASGQISFDAKFNYSSSYSYNSGFAYSNLAVRRDLDAFYQNNAYNHAPTGYGNGFYSLLLTGSRYLKNTYNVISNFAISGIHYPGRPANDPGNNSDYASSSGQPMNSFYTGTFDGIQSQRWLVSKPDAPHSNTDIGIGYGGGYGQLFFNRDYFGAQLPRGIELSASSIFPSIEYIQSNDSQNSLINKSIILWPTINDFDGIEILGLAQTNTFMKFKNSTIDINGIWGPPISIQEYNSLKFNLIFQSLDGLSQDKTQGLTASVSFQFYDDIPIGDGVLEGVLSSSVTATGITNSNKTLTYLQAFDRGASYNHNFTFAFEKQLPNAKNMRVFIALVWGGTATTLPVTYKVLAKGILWKKDSTYNSDGFRKISVT